MPVNKGVCCGSGLSKTKLQQDIEQKLYGDMYRTWPASQNHRFNLKSQCGKDSWILFVDTTPVEVIAVRGVDGGLPVFHYANSLGVLLQRSFCRPSQKWTNMPCNELIDSTTLLRVG